MSRAAAAPVLVAALLSLAAPASAERGTGPGGYAWVDCLESDGPPCAYTLAATTDGSSGLCSDEMYNDPFDSIGFAFPFYRASYSDYAVSANGVLYLFNWPLSGVDVVNADLTGLEGRAFLSVLWDDWAMDNWDESFGFCPRDPECSNTGWEPLDVESFQRGAGNDAGVPYREFGWYSTAHHDPCTEDWGEQATFGLRLYADGRIMFLYQDTDLGSPAGVDHGLSATIGITSGFNGEYTRVSFDTASIPTNPYAILFTPPPCPPLACDAIDIAPEPGCQGEAKIFSVSLTGGMPPIVVDWDFNGDTVRDAQGNPVSRTLGPGVYSVTATVTDSCTRPAPQTCMLSTTTTVLANPMPTATPDGPTIFCARDGGSVRIDASPGHATYQWQLDGGDLPGEDGTFTIATLSGTYTVVVTDADGCRGVSRGVIVDAADCPPPCAALTCLGVTVTPNAACEGASQILRANWAGGDGAITVAWDLDGDTTTDATGQQIIRSFAPGTTTIIATVTDSCTLPPGAQSCSMPADVRVNATPTPAISAGGPLSFCALRGESVILTADPGFASYQWMRDLADIPGETAADIVATISGSYVVVVTDADGCSGLSAPVAVDADACTGCAALSCGAVSVLPDPSCEGDTQSLELAISGGQGLVTVGWDLDADTAVDVVGNPVLVQLPVGSVTVSATATDSCVPPQLCTASAVATVRPIGIIPLIEVSGPGARPLLVSPGGGSTTVEADVAATAYNVHSDAIGSWSPSPATGTTCHVAVWTDNGDGTITLAVPIATDHWIVVTSSNGCGEGPTGRSSLGVDRLGYAGWIPCGPAP